MNWARWSVGLSVVKLIVSGLDDLFAGLFFRWDNLLGLLEYFIRFDTENSYLEREVHMKVKRFVPSAFLLKDFTSAKIWHCPKRNLL